jgi:hypothetical protein
LIVDHMGVPRASQGEASYRNLPQLLARTSRSRPRGRRAMRSTIIRFAAFTSPFARCSTLSGRAGCSGGRTSRA